MTNSNTSPDIKADAAQQVCDVIARIVQDEIHSAAQVAMYAGVHVSAVYRWINDGDCPAASALIALYHHTPSVAVKTLLRSLMPAPGVAPAPGAGAGVAPDIDQAAYAEEHLMPSAINLATDVGTVLRYAAATDGRQVADVPADRNERWEMLRMTEQELIAIEQTCQHMRQCIAAQRDQLNGRRTARPLRLADDDQ